MTIKELYEYVLIETNKVGTATVLLEDFNFFVYKGIQEYVNRRYSLYDISQQTTDSLQVLARHLRISKTGAITGSIVDAGTTPEEISKYKEDGKVFQLPGDYLHLLNCIVNIRVIQSGYKGRILNDIHSVGAVRLTSDMEAAITNNEFLKPFFTRPYYYLRDSNFVTSTDVDENAPKLEVRVGVLDPFFEIDSVDVTYLKKPEAVVLSSVQRDSLSDTSAVIEFPDYICNEVIKLVTQFILENNKDNRLQTFSAINPDTTSPNVQQPAQQPQADKQ